VKYEADRWHNEINEAKAIAEYEKAMRQTVMWGSIVVFALIIIVAISQIRIAKEKQKTNRMLRKIDKERQDFYRGITHQLRTPLTVVNGMTGQLKKFIPADNEEAQREFEAVERKSNEIVNLVNEMILYNKGIIKEIEVSELGVRSEELGVRSEELSLRSEGVKELSLGVQEFRSAGVQTIASESSNSSTRQLVNLSTCEALNSSTEITNYILVAEDDSDVALLITTILKNNGYNYVWAKDGMEAMEIADRQLPKLIITDIMMPRMDGLEFIKRIREDEEKSHLPIIVVSARAEDRDRLIGVEAGAEVYLGKPFKSEELMLRVRKMLEQREILRLKYSKQIEEADRKDAEEQHREINNADQQFMQKVDEFIYENIMDGELDANSLANSMSMSLTTLNRRIKAITDTNTTNYIRMKRLGRARQLLMNTNMPLGEIQAVCGFESPSYFSRAFKAEYDVTPSEFRKTSKGGIFKEDILRS
jgi:DNA-binding response OmpR family regulator